MRRREVRAEVPSLGVRSVKELRGIRGVEEVWGWGVEVCWLVCVLEG